jgi:RNA polymerase primary sigma factor
VVGKVALVSEAVNYLKKQNGAQPTQKELADYVKIPEDELADILYMIDKAKKDS